MLFLSKRIWAYRGAYLTHASPRARAPSPIPDDLIATSFGYRTECDIEMTSWSDIHITTGVHIDLPAHSTTPTHMHKFTVVRMPSYLHECNGQRPPISSCHCTCHCIVDRDLAGCCSLFAAISNSHRS